ncbi:hypothetical protein B0A52_08819 [Exophiala mesophila]|uniref:Uncharacterized protein n=1 Tax=Exophiala mesophila TaxID=212818 RepID=A0A438MWF7_EXOME|nr:hypothetical protein B0A52_08819 [Exophiala mesophila]
MGLRMMVYDDHDNTLTRNQLLTSSKGNTAARTEAPQPQHWSGAFGEGQPILNNPRENTRPQSDHGGPGFHSTQQSIDLGNPGQRSSRLAFGRNGQEHNAVRHGSSLLSSSTHQDMSLSAATGPVVGAHPASRDDQIFVDDLDKFMASHTEPAFLHEARQYQEGTVPYLYERYMLVLTRRKTSPTASSPIHSKATRQSSVASQLNVAVIGVNVSSCAYGMSSKVE